MKNIHSALLAFSPMTSLLGSKDPFVRMHELINVVPDTQSFGRHIRYYDSCWLLIFFPVMNHLDLGGQMLCRLSLTHQYQHTMALLSEWRVPRR